MVEGVKGQCAISIQRTVWPEMCMVAEYVATDRHPKNDEESLEGCRFWTGAW